MNDRTQAHSTIPEAVVKQVAEFLHSRLCVLRACMGDGGHGAPFRVQALTALAAIPPLTGPGPNGEWGTWEQLPARNQFGNLQHHYLCAVYRFIPETQAPEGRFVPEAT